MITRALLILILLVPVATAALLEEDMQVNKNEINRLIEFFRVDPQSWIPINDGVMGGLSQSRIKATDNGTAVFSGIVSLENNGGFASVRAAFEAIDLSDYNSVVVRIFGDGKRYQLRLRTDNRYDGIAYQASFETTGGAWEEIEIPFSSFLPTYRGRRPRGARPLNTGNICQIGFMITDKQNGPFRLEIKWIGVR
jgi:NADH dehydrogenase [ubiquinone] 1 alpha subcomplex assembly factor 1